MRRGPQRPLPRSGVARRRIGKDTLNLFQSYDWPGNIRELQNVIERAVILSDEETFVVDPSWLTPAALRRLGRAYPLLPILRSVRKR